MKGCSTAPSLQHTDVTKQDVEATSLNRDVGTSPQLSSKFDPSSVGLPEVQVIKSSESGHYLQILAYEPCVMLSSFTTKDSRKPLSALYLQSNPDAVGRIKAAWEMGAEEDLIALAYVEGNSLNVIDCNLKEWKIPFSSLCALSDLRSDDFSSFDLDEDGSFLYWEAVDVHLDMEALRTVVDPALQAKLKAETVMHDEKFGKAVARVRKAANLSQKDMGVSERHVRRIEQGARPKVETLKQLAEAHGLDLNDYLEKVAEELKNVHSTH